MEQKILSYEFGGEGMTRVYENPKWMIGIKNWKPMNDIANINCLERHNETDELFILLSGALLLGKEESAGTFYRKRSRRIFPPFLFWSLVVFALTCVVSGPIPWKTVVPDFLRQFLTRGVHGTYWFVYMIVGLYLVTPLLRIWSGPTFWPRDAGSA